MKSLFFILTLYICLYFYGSNMPSPFQKEAVENNNIVFKNNSLSVFQKDGTKLTHLNCKELITDYHNFQANVASFHVYGSSENNRNKNEPLKPKEKFKQPQEDVFIDANLVNFVSTNDPIIFKENVKITYGKETYLETEECSWNPKDECFHFPQSLSVQSGNSLIKGDKATFDTRDKNVNIESNITSFFTFVNTSEKKPTLIKDEKLSKLTSVGPLIYNNIFKSVTLPHSTTIKNSDFTLSAEKIEFYFNDENKIQLLKAEGNVKINLLQKNIVAWSPKATIDFNEKNYYFTEKDNLTPFVEMNGFRQTSSYIIYNEKTEILRAGPEVKSVKIAPDAKE